MYQNTGWEGRMKRNAFSSSFILISSLCFVGGMNIWNGMNIYIYDYSEQRERDKGNGMFVLMSVIVINCYLL